MSLLSRTLALLARLPAPLTREIRIERELNVPMHDGLNSLADRYSPPDADGLPVVLIRTPYGRGPQRMYAELFAERGYQVIVHSCRGTFGSEGDWLPFQTDRDDGAAVVEWIRRQAWYGGSIGMYGPSYMGYVQWAIAADFPQDIQALAIQVAASQPRAMIYAGGAFALRTMLWWTYLVGNQANGVGSLRIGAGRPIHTRRAVNTIPLASTDRRAIGNHFAFYQAILRAEPADDPLWATTDVSDRVPSVAAATQLLSGWYDIFLLGLLADYRRLVEAGRPPQLIIGPWGHTSLGSLRPTLRESLQHFDHHLRHVADPPTAPVRVYVMGARRWLEPPEWPPPTTDTTLYLQADRQLKPTRPTASPPDRYHFDPQDPTPDLGGSSDPGFRPRNQRDRERRTDVLTYTTPTLPEDLEIVGRPTATLFVRSSRQFTDFFVRLCDVFPSGKSINVCDNLLRLDNQDKHRLDTGARRIVIELWPTAYRFGRTHRIRLQISSAAHPRFARNLGSGEPTATAATFHPADQEVFHDPAHPSCVTLPINAHRPAPKRPVHAVPGRSRTWRR